MKNLALIMMLSVTGVVLSAEEYTIQTISALKESSITPAFEKKVKKSALSSAQIKEGDCNIVTVGKYPTPKAAKADIQKAKAISKDAFVRPLNRVIPKVCESKPEMSNMAMNDENSSVMAPKQEDTVMTSQEKIAVVAQAVSKEAVGVSEVPASVLSEPMAQTETKMEPCKAQPCENSTTVYLYDRNLARKSDISDAIEYYKNSPYHTFRPALALQR